jgi:hypothetical protein
LAESGRWVGFTNLPLGVNVDGTIQMGGSMRTAVIAIGLLVLAAFVFAQTPTGTIEGTVTDPQGAAVAGATITVTNNATAISKELKSDGDGRFTMPFVPPGTYTMTVNAPGFRSAKQENVVVEVSQTRSVPSCTRYSDVKPG